MSHHIRILSLPSREDVLREMQRVGCEEAGCQIMASKGQFYALRIENLRGKAASLLKQMMLSVGGDACVSRGVAAFDDTPAAVVLVGDERHYSRLYPRLRMEPFGLPKVAEEIQRAITTISKTPLPVRCGEREITFDRTQVMGIINTTPDSFSGDGLSTNVEAAVAQGKVFAEAGADLLDIGGESTRPGSEGVSTEEEMARVVPVVEALASEVDVPLSIDSYKPEVCRAALAAGATLINDIWGLRQPGMIELAAETGAAVCIMHMQGQPRDMQHRPHYEDLITEVYDFLCTQTEAAIAGGVAEEQIILDPGFGFGKTVEHNLELVRRLREFRSLGRPVLLGCSRKRTIGELTGKPAEERVMGTAAMNAAGIMNGANIIRVHDVAALVDVARVCDAVLKT
ncbi:MAG: dihydropteroate synthase [Armatimonadota bacterium]